MGKSSSDPAPAPRPAPPPVAVAAPVLAPEAVDPGAPPMKQPAAAIQPAPGTKSAVTPDPPQVLQYNDTVRKRKSKGKQKTGKGLLAQAGGNPTGSGYSGPDPTK